MRKAVYIAIVLWFVRKVFRKLSRGSRPALRLGSTYLPGDHGYVRGYDDPSWRVLVLNWKSCGTECTHVVAGTCRGDLSCRQWNRLEMCVDWMYGNRLEDLAGCWVYVDSCPVGTAEETGTVPPGICRMDAEITDYVRRARI